MQNTRHDDNPASEGGTGIPDGSLPLARDSGELPGRRPQPYDEIAQFWYNRRHWTRFRRELDAMASRWQGGKLLNIGSAHGADFLPFAKNAFRLVGLDSAARMLQFALKYRKKHDFEADLVLADARWLPFGSATFNWAISVATYHHIQGHEGRMMALDELRRVLKPGGEAFITVWNRWQIRFWFRGREVLVPWRTKQGPVNRYYYLFSRPELVRVLKQSGFEVLRLLPETSLHFPMAALSKNICALVRKPYQQA